MLFFAVVLKYLNQNQQICQRKDGMPQQQTVCFTDCAGSLFLQRTRRLFPQVVFSVAFRQMLESHSLHWKHTYNVSRCV